jgi:hypothetical protein
MFAKSIDKFEFYVILETRLSGQKEVMPWYKPEGTDGVVSVGGVPEGERDTKIAHIAA